MQKIEKLQTLQRHYQDELRRLKREAEDREEEKNEEELENEMGSGEKVEEQHYDWQEEAL